MPNTYFQFKQFRIDQENCAMKVCTDACILGAWYAAQLQTGELAGNSKQAPVKRILDVGSGTGLLMMMLAQKTKTAIDGIEIEPECFRQMKINIAQNEWNTRLTALHGDARTYAFDAKYDFIISNPPFYENDLSSPAHGRQLAMHSESLKFDELLEVLVNNLSPAGSVGIMLPSHRASAFGVIAIKKGLHVLEELSLKQTPAHNCFRTITTYGFYTPANIKRSVLVIKDTGNAYTKEFVQLLAPYYLHLAESSAD